MKIYVKVGTLPACWMRVAFKRKPPKVGETFKLRPEGHGMKLVQVYLHEIRGAAGCALHVVELM